MISRRLITATDAHTGGNPERVVTGGIPPVPGKNMLEKSRYLRQHWDHLRTFLVHEARGHSNMYASLLFPPTVEGADFGVVYLEPGGYATMCGHGTIAICTVLVETGIIEASEPKTEIVLDTPAGIVRATVSLHGCKAESVTIRNVPSFLYKEDVKVEVPEIGPVKLDIVYGGNFYAILPAVSLDLEVRPQFASKLIQLGTKIWRSVNEQIKVVHPEKPEIDCVNYVEFSAPPTLPGATMKNAVVVPPGGMDRSPCGTGTSAAMALLYSRSEIGLNELFVHESITGSLFYGRLVEETEVGKFRAVVPSITGSAHITGMHQFLLDSDDPFPFGFYLDKQEKLYGFQFHS